MPQTKESKSISGRTDKTPRNLVLKKQILHSSISNRLLRSSRRRITLVEAEKHSKKSTPRNPKNHSSRLIQKICTEEQRFAIKLQARSLTIIGQHPLVSNTKTTFHRGNLAPHNRNQRCAPEWLLNFAQRQFQKSSAVVASPIVARYSYEKRGSSYGGHRCRSPLVPGDAGLSITVNRMIMRLFDGVEHGLVGHGRGRFSTVRGPCTYRYLRARTDAHLKPRHPRTIMRVSSALGVSNEMQEVRAGFSALWTLDDTREPSRRQPQPCSRVPVRIEGPKGGRRETERGSGSKAERKPANMANSAGP
ncbi:hypothetical protein KM043_005174 [Ampulex compressa]|nr:hypothetical protein KM043_005174 [Ampulex compressa]